MLKKTLLIALVALGAMASGSALAHGHVRFGVFIGGPAYWPGPYYSPYYSPYYYPPVVAVPAAPPTYIEQGDERPAAAREQSYWYYCAEPKAYYPYVKQCPGGWQQVAPQPPAR